MKTRRTKKHTTPIWKVGCALLASCILLSSCGQSAQNAQGSLQELTSDAKEPTAMPGATQSLVLTATPEAGLTNTPMPEPTPTETPTPEPTPTDTPTPEPTPTNTPIPTPTSTPEPTPKPFTFIPDTRIEDEAAIGEFLYSETESFSEFLSEYGDFQKPDGTVMSDFLSQEDIDTVFSFAYNPDIAPQLFARYRGQLKEPDCYYCIDMIQMNPGAFDMLLNIQIMSGEYRFETSELLQNIYFYVDYVDAELADLPFQLIDLNNDGYQDFLFDLGFTGMRNKYSTCFIYDVEQEEYVFLGSFLTPLFIPEKQMIWERSYGGMSGLTTENKYIISGGKAILMESLSYYSGLWECYTYIKRIDGVLTTVKKNVGYDEMWKAADIEEWEGHR